MRGVRQGIGGLGSENQMGGIRDQRVRSWVRLGFREVGTGIKCVALGIRGVGLAIRGLGLGIKWVGLEIRGVWPSNQKS